MIATIPYTQNIDEMIAHLAKYGHDLKHIPKNPAAAFRFRYFGCNVCGAHMILRPSLTLGPHARWEVYACQGQYMNINHDECADFYCMKYRALHG